MLFRSMTPRSIVTVEGLRKELKRTAAQGYAVSWEEHAVGVSAIGLPIMKNRKCVGVVTVAAPSARRTREEFLAWLPAMKSAADKLGASWPEEPTGPLPSL